MNDALDPSPNTYKWSGKYPMYKESAANSPSHSNWTNFKENIEYFGMGPNWSSKYLPRRRGQGLQ